MKISLNELAVIDRYLDDQMDPDERQLFESRLLSDTDLRKNVDLQKQARHIVVLHGRSKLRTSLEVLHRSYFTDAAHFVFRERVLSYFR